MGNEEFPEIFKGFIGGLFSIENLYDKNKEPLSKNFGDFVKNLRLDYWNSGMDDILNNEYLISFMRNSTAAWEKIFDQNNELIEDEYLQKITDLKNINRTTKESLKSYCEELSRDLLELEYRTLNLLYRMNERELEKIYAQAEVLLPSMMERLGEAERLMAQTGW